VTGIHHDKAAAIWYRALTVYMTSSTGYAGARVANVNAATDLYGATSPEVAAVKAAFSAISVNRQFDQAGGTTPPASCPLCRSHGHGRPPAARPKAPGLAPAAARSRHRSSRAAGRAGERARA